MFLLMNLTKIQIMVIAKALRESAEAAEHNAKVHGPGMYDRMAESRHEISSMFWKVFYPMKEDDVCYLEKF